MCQETNQKISYALDGNSDSYDVREVLEGWLDGLGIECEEWQIDCLTSLFLHRVHMGVPSAVENGATNSGELKGPIHGKKADIYVYDELPERVNRCPQCSGFGFYNKQESTPRGPQIFTRQCSMCKGTGEIGEIKFDPSPPLKKGD